MRFAVVVCVLALVLAACGGSDGTPSDTGVPENPQRCEDAPQEVLDYLSTGIIIEGMTMPWGQAVKSSDYDDVWIVAGAVETATDMDFGVWAIRAGLWPTDYIGTVSVDTIAKQVSTWGKGTDIIVTEFTDGVKSASACAIEKLG